MYNQIYQKITASSITSSGASMPYFFVLRYYELWCISDISINNTITSYDSKLNKNTGQVHLVRVTKQPLAYTPQLLTSRNQNIRASM